MGGFVAAIPRRGRWSDDLIAQVVRVSEQRAPDGVSYTVSDSGTLLLQCNFAHTAESLGERLPKTDPTGRYTVVKRGHLTNRSDLQRVLRARVADHTPLSTDADLMLAAYSTWGPDFGGRLEGEFTLAIWDSLAESLVVLRDHLGRRPCFVHDGPSGFIAATEATQIRPFPGVSLDPDEIAIADYVAGRFVTRTRTFATSIRRPMPASLTRADRTGTTSRLYWEPEFRNGRMGRPFGEYVEAVSHAAHEAIVESARSAGHVVTELSGGLDSSSIFGVAMTASELEARRISAVSVLYPGMDCDEQPFIEAARRLHSCDWQGFDGRPDAESLRQSGPAVAHGLRPLSELQSYLTEVDTRVVLCGEGGDEMFHSDPLPFDRGLWPPSSRLRYLSWGSRQSVRLMAARVRSEVVRPMVPDALLGTYLKLKRVPEYPTMLTPRGWKLAEAAYEEECGSSPLQNYSRARMWSPPQQSTVEMFDMRDLRLGRETRSPLLDMRIARVVLDAPLLVHRWGGQWRALQKAAFGQVLPAEILARRSKAEFTSVRVGSVAPGREQLPDVSGVVDLGLVERTWFDGEAGSLEPESPARKLLLQWQYAHYVQLWLDHRATMEPFEV